MSDTSLPNSGASPAIDTPVAEPIGFRIDAGVAWITINRPEVKNALSPDHRDTIMDHLDEAAERLDVRAVVLTGTGSAFCTGADLRSPRPPRPRPEGAPSRVAGEVSRGIRTNAQRLITTVMDCEKPVIAAVNGVAAGMGAHLALACDLVIAADDASFVEVFVRRGLVPDAGGAYLLSRILGPHKAKELFFFGDAVNAHEAHSLGLVNRVVPAADLLDAAAQWANRLATGPSRAISFCKALVNRSMDLNRAESLNAEAVFQDLNMTTADAQEGVLSFVERRSPVWQGW
ncbi:MAG: enoyl-CoA hydratase-related protein [Ilumatobacteraceae bacterium]